MFHQDYAHVQQVRARFLKPHERANLPLTFAVLTIRLRSLSPNDKEEDRVRLHLSYTTYTPTNTTSLTSNLSTMSDLLRRERLPHELLHLRF